MPGHGSVLIREITETLERHQAELEDLADAMGATIANLDHRRPPRYSEDEIITRGVVDYLERLRTTHLLPARAGLRSYIANFRDGL